MASRFNEFYSDANEAYRSSRFLEAAMLLAQAKTEAKLLGDRAKYLQAGTWEAMSWTGLCEYKHAYALLFSLLQEGDEDFPTYERWIAEQGAYTLWVDLGNRSRAERIEHLKRLRRGESRCHEVAPGDLPYLYAQVELDSANWEKALAYLEEACTRKNGYGYAKSGIQKDAIYALLRLAQEEEANRWLKLIEQTEQDSAYGRLYYHLGQARITLYQPIDYQALEMVCKALEEDLIGTDHQGNSFARHMMVRIWLIIRSEESPSDPFHPARAALRHRPSTGIEWGRILIRIDYYLACLRFLLGIAPCDDYYYRHPSPMPQVLKRPEANVLDRCLRRLCGALARGARYAKEQDELNETEWYSNEIASRMNRMTQMLEMYQAEE